jgi:hypothetical protein
MPKFTKEKPKRAIDAIAQDTAEWHFTHADAKAELANHRLELFEAITESFRAPDSTRAQKTVVASKAKFKDFTVAEAYVDKYNAGWQRLSMSETDDAYRFILIEDPEFMAASILVKPTEDFPSGFVVTKTVRSGTMMYDLDRMKDEDHDLYLAVTWMPNEEFLADMLYHANMDADEIVAYIDTWATKYGVMRQPKSAEQLTSEQIEAIRPYMYEGKKTVALNVREAKPEDFDVR